MNTKKSNEPLFYIQQPELEFPKLDMQDVFRSKKTDGKCHLCDIEKKPIHDGQSKWIRSEESERKDISMEKPQGLFAHNETVFSVSMPMDRDELLEQNSDEIKKDEMVERQEKEPLDLNYDHFALQDMIAQYEMKRQFEIESRPLSSEKSHTISLNKAKPFKEMEINEKLEYLTRFPKPLPPVPCIFAAGNRSIRGFLVSNNERKIDIKTFDEKILTIPILELKDIQMIGME